MTQALAEFGVIGTAVMGRNLALNLCDHGLRVMVWNREPVLRESAIEASEGRLVGAETLADLVQGLERPRRILIMIRAGAPVDMVLETLMPLLDPGDIVIDGGNSLFQDTRRREALCRQAGFYFVGMGVSGGEEGARHGPSLMVGGDSAAYAKLKPTLEAIAAKSDSGPCVAHCGSDGAGHFVKMVHNGIEYADMQLIAEAYDLLRRIRGLTAPELAQVFEGWNRGPIESFLIEITAQILRAKDPETGQPLVDHVLDQAGQKGTGRWTAQVALDLGVSIPCISAAIDARVLSSMKRERVRASSMLAGPQQLPGGPPSEKLSAASVEDALYASKITSYAQGMALIQAGAVAFGWNTELSEVARIWKGGCIIRARLLDSIMRAFASNPKLPNLLLDPELSGFLVGRQTAWRQVIADGVTYGVPLPTMSASLSYYDSFRAADLPQNLTQAQRDAFGAHTYQRKDDPDGPFIHTDWLGLHS